MWRSVPQFGVCVGMLALCSLECCGLVSRTSVEFDNGNGFIHDDTRTPTPSRERIYDAAGLAAGAYMTIQSDVTATHLRHNDDVVSLYYLVMNQDQISGWYDTNHDTRVIGVQSLSTYVSLSTPDPDFESSPSAMYICGTPAYRRKEVLVGNTSISTEFTFHITDTDQYAVYVAYCDTIGTVSVSTTVSYVNPDGDGGATQQLDIQYVMLPSLYGGLSFAYGLASMVWFIECARFWDDVLPLQVGIGGSMFLFMVSCATKSSFFGTLNDVGEVGSQLVRFTRLMEGLSNGMFLCLMLLISLGWSVGASIVNRRDQSALYGLFFLYALVGWLLLSCEQNKPEEDCASFELTEYVIRSLMLLAIIVAMNFNITHIRQSLIETPPPITAHMAVLYSKLNQLQIFRWAFLAYLLCPTMLLILDAAVLESWKYGWINDLLENLTFMLIHIQVVCSMAPSAVAVITTPFDRTLD